MTNNIIISYGETLWDLLPTGAKLGGAPFNLAYRANSLGDRGVIATRLGDDDLGRQVRAAMSQLNMDPLCAQTDASHPTGVVQVSFKDGEPEYFIVPDVAYDYIEPANALLELAAEAQCVCYGTLIQRSPRSRETLEQVLHAAAHATKLLDINLRKDCHSAATIASSLREADVLKLNELEAEYLSESFRLGALPLPEFCDDVIDRFSLECCVVTLGQRGAYAAASDGSQVYMPGYKVQVKDSIGAGDAFTAAFTHHYLRKQPLAACCDYGCALGALVATQCGPTEPISPEEIETFIRSAPPRVRQTSLEPFAVA